MAEPVQNVHNNRWLSKIKAGATGAGVAAVAIVIVMFVPLIPLTVEEEVQTMQTRTISEQVMVPQTNKLFSQEDYTIQPNASYKVTVPVAANSEVEFEVRASDTVDTSVRTIGIPIYGRDDVSNTRYKFTAPIDGDYTFEVFNDHNGVLGIGSKTVGLYSAAATETWQETVTKERVVTEPVTEKRMVTKNVTVPELIMSSIRLPTIG